MDDFGQADLPQVLSGNTLLSGKISYATDVIPQPEDIDAWYKALAIRNVKGFASILYHLAYEKDFHFDTIIAAGNSGLAMAHITHLVYGIMGIPIPHVVKLPIRRFKNPNLANSHMATPDMYFDNSVLLTLVEEQLKDVPFLQSMLFVDDEMSGRTARVCTELVMQASKPKRHGEIVTLYMTGEDFGTKWVNNMPDVKVKFYPFAQEIKGVRGVLPYIIPSYLSLPIRRFFNPVKIAIHGRMKNLLPEVQGEPEIGRKVIMNILLGLPIKDVTKDIPTFTEEFTQMARDEIENYMKIHIALESYLIQVVSDGIKEYEIGRIRIVDLN